MKVDDEGISRREALRLGLLAAPGAALLVGGLRAGRARDWRATAYVARGAVLATESDGSFAVTTVLGQVYRTNATGARLWPLLDGRHTGADLVDALIVHAGIGRPSAERDVAVFLSDLVRAGVVSTA